MEYGIRGDGFLRLATRTSPGISSLTLTKISMSAFPAYESIGPFLIGNKFKTTLIRREKTLKLTDIQFFNFKHMFNSARFRQCGN